MLASQQRTREPTISVTETEEPQETALKQERFHSSIYIIRAGKPAALTVGGCPQNPSDKCLSRQASYAGATAGNGSTRHKVGWQQTLDGRVET